MAFADVPRDPPPAMIFHGMEQTASSHALLARLVELAEDAIVSANVRQEIILFNRGAEKTFGYKAQEVLGRPLEMLLPNRLREEHRGQVERFGAGEVMARRMGERSEVLGLRKGGDEFPAEAAISKQVVEGATIFTAILRDVSERKRNEREILQLNQDLERRVVERTAELQVKTEELRELTQQLWQAAKLASVGEVAAGIAHELNNPMATVTLRIESVINKTSADDPRRKSLEIAEQELQRMSSLVANLLHFSRRSQDQYLRVDVCVELIKTVELVQYLLKKHGIVVRQEFDLHTPHLHADRQKIRQVFLNLLTNAADAMEKGGILTLILGPTRLDDGRLAVRIEVRDTGTGIAAAALPHIFEPFFTTKAEGKGTGLGLPICKRIVEEHRGTLSIESVEGRGACVKISLPAIAAAEGRR
ncbi:MAG: ATP-binding protein [Planctomycetota bacterium]